MKVLYMYAKSTALIVASLLLGWLAPGAGHASQFYGLTPDASVEFEGRAAAPLTGTARLGFAGFCIAPPNQPERCAPIVFNFRELDLVGDGVELALQPLPEIPRAGFIFSFRYDIRVEEESGEIALDTVTLEREILAEGERQPGDGFVEYRELRLVPMVNIDGSSAAELIFSDPRGRYPNGFRLEYELQEFVATIIFDTNDGEDGRLFFPFIEPGSQSAETLGLVTIQAEQAAEPPPPLPTEGEFRGLGPARGESHATGIANDGRSVSGYARHLFSSIRGFRWTQGSGSRISLGNLRGLGSNLGLAISPNGKRVAGSFDAAQYSTPSHEAARWNDLLELDRLDRAERPANLELSRGEDITSDGTVVGWQVTESPYRIQAQRWSAEGLRTPLLDLAPNVRPFSRAHAFSEDASITVGVSARNNQVPNTAVRWTELGIEDLGALADGAHSWAWDVSDTGDTVVGWSGNEDLEREAFRWMPGKGMKGLGDLPGGVRESEAYAISGDGRFVVGSSTTENGEEAFIWDSGRGMRRLQDVIEHALGAELEGWQLTRATGITPDGGVIIGDGINFEGYTEAWRAVLPAARTDIEISLLPQLRKPSIPPHLRRIKLVVMGSDTADVHQIDFESLAFGPGQAAPIHRVTSHWFTLAHIHDLNRDGQSDLVLHFVAADSGLSKDDTEGCLSGEIDGRRFSACDSLEVMDVPKGKSPKATGS